VVDEKLAGKISNTIVCGTPLMNI